MFIANMTKKNVWTKFGCRVEYEFTFDFKNKEEYLQQRNGWRREYKELSKRIRQHKLWRKKRLRPRDLEDWKNLSTLWTLQEQARMMCQMRIQSKQQAYRQMMAQKAA